MEFPCLAVERMDEGRHGEGAFWETLSGLGYVRSQSKFMPGSTYLTKTVISVSLFNCLSL